MVPTYQMKARKKFIENVVKVVHGIPVRISDK